MTTAELFVSDISSLQVITAHPDIITSNHGANDQRDIGVARSKYSLILQVNEGFGIIGIACQSLLPLRQCTTNIARHEFIAGLRLETTIRPVGVKGERAVTDADILAVGGFGDTYAVGQGWYRCGGGSWSATSVPSRIMGEIQCQRSH